MKDQKVVVSLHVLLHSSVSGRFLLPAPVEAFKKGGLLKTVFMTSEPKVMAFIVMLSLSLSIHTAIHVWIAAAESQADQ